MAKALASNRGKTALITGSSSGIGYALAHCFAVNGYNLVLVSRDQQRLERLAVELRRKARISVKVIAKDLARPTSPDEIVEQLQREGIDVDILVNNAGFGMHGPFSEADVCEQLRLMQLNIASLTHLSRLLLPGMLRKRAGKILNVASTAAFQPGPLMAIYYASKAYVLSLSEALANELRGFGVTVTALCPGPTRTEFQARAGIAHTRLMSSGIMNAETVADIGYRGLMAGKRVVIPGLGNKLLAIAARWAPRAIVLSVVRSMQERR
jgi:short-subunit dehydrogenase